MPAFAFTRPRCLAVAAAFVVAGLALPAEAQWKWRDPSGRVQYSDRPPPSSTAEADILQQPSAARRATLPIPASAAQAASAAPPPAPKASEPELEARRRRAEQDEAVRRRIDEERQAAVRADNCIRARGQLRMLEDGLRMTRINERGEREILDDEARAAETQRVRAAMASDCR